MYTNLHSLKLFGILVAVLFIAAPAQCTEQWLPGEGLPGLGGPAAHATVVYDDGTGPALYVVGQFTVAGEVIANYIARWDGTNWSPVGSGMSGSVYALTVYNGELIAGGAITVAGGIEANHITRCDGTTWSIVGSGGGMSDSVRALTVYDGDLIAGCFFTHTGALLEVSHIAHWDGMRWSLLGSGMSSVSALTVHNNKLIAEGYFATVGVI